MAWTEQLAAPEPAQRGGVANRGRVFRVGDTVLRPVAPARTATHAVLTHLSEVGFAGAPRLIAAGADSEVLSWIEGRAATAPLPDWALGDTSLVSVAELIRAFHQAVAPFDPSGYSWPEQRVPAPFTEGTVGHNDLHPGNVVFSGDRAVGIIDFDLAGPGGVIWDVATAARSWCPLIADEDIEEILRDRRIERFALFLDAYGLSRADRAQVVEALVPNHDWTYRIVTDSAAAGHSGFRNYWFSVSGRAGRARDWTVRHRRELEAAVG